MSGIARTVRALVVLVPLCAALALLGCGGGTGDQGPAGPQGPPGPDGPPGQDGQDGADADSPLGVLEPLPGVNVAIQGLTGGTGAGGSFVGGNTMVVTYRVTDDAGADLDVKSFDFGEIYGAGPTTNYQPLWLAKFDLIANSTSLGGGLWQYTLTIPSVYPAPYNDSPAFGLADGELQGQAILAGTYTVAIDLLKEYEVSGGDTAEDSGTGLKDFLVGGATVLEPREVVTNAACNACHAELKFHGSIRSDVRGCVLCHTAGSEDRNTAAVAGGTPGVSIDFDVMIHRIHSGSHLPSVLGVGTEATGARNYSVTPKPLQYIGYMDSLHDYSHAGFPVMPSAYVAYLYNTAGTTYDQARGNGPMPRDAGFGALPAASKEKEDRIRTGVVSCASCHGGAAQASLAETTVNSRTCTSCHDDMEFGSKAYTANGFTHQPDLTDDACVLCHGPGGLAPVAAAHLHPYSNPAFNTGINVDVVSVTRGPALTGNHQNGDRVYATFSVTNDAGADVSVHSTVRFQAVVNGPTTNPGFLAGNFTLFDTTWRKSPLFTGGGSITTPAVGAGAVDGVHAVVFTGALTFDFYRLPVGGSGAPTLVQGGNVLTDNGTTPFTLGGVSFSITDAGAAFVANDRWYMEIVPTAATYSKYIPNDLSFEFLGNANGTGADQAFTIANSPIHWGRQTVWMGSLVAPSTTLLATSPYLGRSVQVNTTTLALAVGDRVVLDRGLSTEEYVQVGLIENAGTNATVWFTTAMRYPHTGAGTLQEVTLSSGTLLREGTDYAFTDAGAGTLNLLAVANGAGNLDRPLVVSYRADLRFGRYRRAGDALQAVYDASAQDTDVILDATWGDWKGLPFVDGTYRVGFWVNRDYNVSGNLPPAYNTGESTTYRMISPPAFQEFLYGSATTIVSRRIIEDAEVCNRCHGDLTFHGNGRRGLETCLACHAGSGLEDGAKYAFATWYTGMTPGVTMDFRTMIHKIHMGEELTQAYTAVGVFLGVPYNASFNEVVYPHMPGGTKVCVSCHGDANTAWLEPATRKHPSLAYSALSWKAVCTSCHDSDGAVAHVDSQTSSAPAEGCPVCHGDGKEWSVQKVHFPR